MMAYLLKSKHSQKDWSDFCFFRELPVEVSTKSESTFQVELDILVQANTV